MALLWGCQGNLFLKPHFLNPNDIVSLGTVYGQPFFSGPPTRPAPARALGGARCVCWPFSSAQRLSLAAFPRAREGLLLALLSHGVCVGTGVVGEGGSSGDRGLSPSPASGTAQGAAASPCCVCGPFLQASALRRLLFFLCSAICSLGGHRTENKQMISGLSSCPSKDL